MYRQASIGLPSAQWASFQFRGLRRSPIKVKDLPVPKKEKRLDVVIMGVPNVGKSVLLNTLLKTKLAATSRKRHTTRREVLGVFNHRNTQLAFYDTPGYTKQSEANKEDVKELRNITVDSSEKADVVLLVCDGTKVSSKYHDTFAEMARLALENAKLEVILVINKVDLVEPKNALLNITRTFVGLINYAKLGIEGRDKAALDTTTFMISALQNDGVLDLKNYLLSIAQQKPWIMEKAAGPSDMGNEERIEEVMLEMMMEHVHEEIPYVCKIHTRSIEAVSDMKMNIEVDLYLESPSQARVVIGQFGRTINKVRVSAVSELELIFGRKVNLQIYVNKKITKEVEEEDQYK